MEHNSAPEANSPQLTKKVPSPHPPRTFNIARMLIAALGTILSQINPIHNLTT